MSKPSILQLTSPDPMAPGGGEVFLRSLFSPLFRHLREEVDEAAPVPRLEESRVRAERNTRIVNAVMPRDLPDRLRQGDRQRWLWREVPELVAEALGRQDLVRLIESVRGEFLRVADEGRRLTDVIDRLEIQRFWHAGDGALLFDLVVGTNGEGRPEAIVIRRAAELEARPDLWTEAVTGALLERIEDTFGEGHFERRERAPMESALAKLESRTQQALEDILVWNPSETTWPAVESAIVLALALVPGLSLVDMRQMLKRTYLTRDQWMHGVQTVSGHDDDLDRSAPRLVDIHLVRNEADPALTPRDVELPSDPGAHPWPRDLRRLRSAMTRVTMVPAARARVAEIIVYAVAQAPERHARWLQAFEEGIAGRLDVTENLHYLEVIPTLALLASAAKANVDELHRGVARVLNRIIALRTNRDVIREARLYRWLEPHLQACRDGRPGGVFDAAEYARLEVARTEFDVVTVAGMLASLPIRSDAASGPNVDHTPLPETVRTAHAKQRDRVEASLRESLERSAQRMAEVEATLPARPGTKLLWFHRSLQESLEITSLAAKLLEATMMEPAQGDEPGPGRSLMALLRDLLWKASSTTLIRAPGDDLSLKDFYRIHRSLSGLRHRSRLTGAERAAVAAQVGFIGSLMVDVCSAEVFTERERKRVRERLVGVLELFLRLAERPSTPYLHLVSRSVLTYDTAFVLADEPRMRDVVFLAKMLENRDQWDASSRVRTLYQAATKRFLERQERPP